MDKRCRENYGYKPGMPAYGECRDRHLQMTIGVTQHDQAVAMQAQAARAQPFSNAGQAIQNIQIQPYQMPTSQNSSVTINKAGRNPPWYIAVVYALSMQGKRYRLTWY
jgi:hypothetical protein